MKKLIALMLCLLMTLSLAACGGETADEQMITRPAEETQAAEVPAQTEAPAAAAPEAETPKTAAGYTFLVDGVELVPGAPFDPSVLSAYDSVYEVPSCAIEGTDNLYSYGTYEITAFDDGTGEVIYSILLLDPNITTTEGLALGDDAAKAVELYGDGYTVQGTSWVYTGEQGLLILIIQNDAVASIEYRMIVA